MEKRAKLKDRLHEALNVRHMKAAELSERTNVPKGAISYYLAGKSSPKGDRTYILAKALDVSEAWLMGFDVPMERTQEQKKNDRLSELIVRLRRDPAIFNIVEKMDRDPALFAIVEMLDRVPPEQLENLGGLVAGLVKE